MLLVCGGVVEVVKVTCSCTMKHYHADGSVHLMHRSSSSAGLYNVVQCSRMFHGVPWCSMVFHGVPWCSMVFHDVPWCSMILHK